MRRLQVTEFLDKLLLLLSMLVFVWVGVSAIRGARRLDSIAGKDRPLISEMLRNAPRFEANAPKPRDEIWEVPTSQSRGKNWVFDVFTPPVIYYDPTLQSFAVTPPNMRPTIDDSSQWARFEIELLEVRLRPYRLQLVGYVGSTGNYVAYLELASTGELLLAKEGQELPKAEIRLLSFQVQQMEIANKDSMPVIQSVGVARILDLRTGKELSLTNLETKMFSDLEARVRDLHTGSIHLVKTGSRLELDGSDYVIGDLSANPEAANITKISKDGERKFTKVLTPTPKPGVKPSGSQEPAPHNPFAIRPNRPGAKPEG